MIDMNNITNACWRRGAIIGDAAACAHFIAICKMSDEQVAIWLKLEQKIAELEGMLGDNLTEAENDLWGFTYEINLTAFKSIADHVQIALEEVDDVLT